MNKFKTIFGVFLGATMLLGVGASISSIRNNTDIKEVNAATTWYLRGTMNNWTGSDAYAISEGGAPLIIDLTSGAKFKVVNHTTNWSNSGATELTTSNGDASGYGITFSSGNDSVVNTSGKYAFTVKDGALFVDFGEFYYSGTDNTWGTDTTTTGRHPKVVVNSENPTVWTLSKEEAFKIRNNNWDKGVFGFTNIKNYNDYFYGILSGKSNGDILCNATNTDIQFNVSIALNNREWTVKVFPTTMDDTSKVYVLDKYGDKLNTRHQAHFYNDNGQTMGWPGMNMTTYSGTTHMYEAEFWSGLSKVIFNNKNGDDGVESWAYDVSGDYSRAGYCLILDDSIDGDGKWSSNYWVIPETAKFIENCMHFANYKEGQSGKNECISSGWYTTAKNAYTNLSSTAKEEVVAIDYVVQRLQAWAAANHEAFTVNNGVGTFSAARITNVVASQESNNALTIITIIAAIGVLTTGAYMFFKKGKKVEQ